MIDFTIKTENDKIKEALSTFITQYKANITEYINQYVAHYHKDQLDTSITNTGGEMVINAINNDKGIVIGEVDGGELPVQLTSYVSLPVGKKYMVQDQAKMALYIKTAPTETDVKVGAWNTLQEGIAEWNSIAIQNELERIDKAKKIKEKDENRLRRLGKTPASAENFQEAEVVQEHSMNVNE